MNVVFLELFQNSIGITSISENFLTATTLADSYYLAMFKKCVSLTKALDLPATTLEDNCYMGIFYRCISLNLIKIGILIMSLNTNIVLPQLLYWFNIGYTSNYSDDYFKSWVNGVADSGIFHYNGSQTAQDFGLPSGWQKTTF